MKKIVRIPLLRQPNVKFRAGAGGHEISYSTEFIKDQLKKIDKDVYLYTDYCDNESDDNLYIMKIFTDTILHSVYKNKHYSEEPALRMKKYDEKYNVMLCEIDESSSIKNKLLEVIYNDKVYITFIINYNNDDNSIEFDRAALCLGIVGHHILFI